MNNYLGFYGTSKLIVSQELLDDINSIDNMIECRYIMDENSNVIIVFSDTRTFKFNLQNFQCPCVFTIGEHKCNAVVKDLRMSNMNKLYVLLM